MAHEIDPEYKVGNMIIYAASYPFTCNPDDVLEVQKYNRLYNYYCIDVQAKEFIHPMQKIIKRHGCNPYKRTWG